MSKHCIIVSGGEYHPIPAPDSDAFIIACDRGYEYCIRSGIRPDLVIGDFDSYSGSISEDVPVLHLPCVKDDTDTMSAVRYALASGYRDLRFYCVLGGRLDHTLANLQTLCFAARQGALAAADSPDCRIYALKEGRLRLSRREGFSLSVFAAEDRCRVSLSGVKYPLKEAEITSFFPIGVSNEWTAHEAEITVSEGTLLIVESML